MAQGKSLKLICGIDGKVRGAKLLVYNKNSEKTSKVKRHLQLIVPLEIVIEVIVSNPSVSIIGQEKRLQKMLV